MAEEIRTTTKQKRKQTRQDKTFAVPAGQKREESEDRQRLRVALLFVVLRVGGGGSGRD